MTSNTTSDDLLAFSTLSVDQLVELQSNLQTRLSSLAVPPPPAPKRRKQTHATTKPTATTGASSTQDELEVSNDSEQSAPDAVVSESTAAATNSATLPSETLLVPQLDKTIDTHYDYLLKELQWLAADFSSERARHASRRKQLASSLKQHVASQVQRLHQQLAQAEVQRRKLAAKMARDVQRKWWDKMNRIIAFEQKQSLEQSRAAAMNKQLVQLVQLTEQYTRALTHTVSGQQGDGSTTTTTRLTIEQALAQGEQLSTRRSKLQVTNYARLQTEGGRDEYLYGESTASEDSGDESYLPNEHDELLTDDETTMRQAEQEERALRRGHDFDEDDMDDQASTTSFRADPIELQKLQEEANMPIEDVLVRLQSETTRVEDAVGEEQAMQVESPPQRRVRFHTVGSADVGAESDLLKEDDDDAMMDMVAEEDDDDGSEEFVADETEVDDETTLAQEEALPKEMSAQEEIDLLRIEGDMSIEELRRLYSRVLGRQDGSGSSSDELMEGEDGESTSDGDDQSATASHLLTQIVDDAEDQEEFQPDGEEVDDETTMEAEERQGRDMSYGEELALLRREGEMSVEELRAMYVNADNAMDTDDGDSDVDENDESIADSSAVDASVSELLGPLVDVDQEQEEYQPDNEEVDDETTMEVEESMGRDMSYEEEIALLRQEGELSIEELRAQYMNAGDEDVGSTSSGGSVADSSADEDEDDDGAEGADAALQALEASSEQARRTLASRPYLLASWVKLREYQQIGLNWLVSLQSRRLNGILADEMGLGKTLQTISLLGYLAAYKGIWGPHLVVVPTSVLLNWETELKRFCPGLKVLCYYGSAKRRKELRQGWTKSNWFHVVLTSYQLAVQDSFAFRRKKWYYLVLDEAQNIKNFQSQRWQTLINFNTQRRLLLTGTPLQNNLMELWSLLHFLMPYVFRSRKEFSYWFANPMSGIVGGTRSHNEDVITRLHGIIRPFVLRRLKKDVESQMPGKFEHIVKCQLSRRQMFIYEEFMARSSTRQSLRKGGNFMDMMNVLMQLRKVCNHPDLFEPRPVITPFAMETISLSVPSDVMDILQSSACATASLCLVAPIWSGSCGLPSSPSALRHDTLEHEALLELHEMSPPQQNDKEEVSSEDFSAFHSYGPDLSLLWSELAYKRREEVTHRLNAFARINRSRCGRAPFPYSSRLLNAANIGTADEKIDIFSTPAALLAMRRTQRERAADVEELVKKFVFCVPKASACSPILEASSNPKNSQKRREVDEILLEPLEQAALPFQEADARLSSCFPDKNLVQFDAGKLQVLAELLRELKRGGHRVLIFTQMSKMLDILEAFLNLHGYTYMRLDGSTSVDRRQRLMDRFNSDDKVFCFILSTRSGGLGINLVGADTVIFYDSDWNSAMDAQAQDRAHRIGQTREVHIYRLVTQHTIEENILLKAQQKRKLDMLVMDKGHFDSSQLFGHGKEAKATLEPADVGKLYTAGGLRDILGVDKSDDDVVEAVTDAGEGQMSTEDMEKAMTTLEDDDDVVALRGAQKEAADELLEFDETVEIRNRAGSDDEDDDDDKPSTTIAQPTKKSKEASATDDAEDQKNSDEELEREIEAWQDKAGIDFATLTASLRPAERYSLRFRQEVDPYYSVFAITEYNQQIDAANASVEQIDYAAIEREKALEEQLAFDNGDLLGTFPQPDDLIRQRALYQREKTRLRASKMRRKLTGEAWEVRKDSVSGLPFWYNIDTGEALWDKPKVLEELEALELAAEKHFEAMPDEPLRRVMEFLLPYPERMSCALVSKRWHAAATCPSFVKHVYPVELGAYTREDSKVEHNHFRTISDALANALPGDTIELGDGHYWINEEKVNVPVPIRIVGDEHDPSNVVVEVVHGTIHWQATRGYCEGVTFRRPQMPTGDKLARDLLCIEPKGKLDVICSTFDNQGSSGQVVCANGRGMKGVWRNVIVNGGSIGLCLNGGAGFGLIASVIRNQSGDGVVCDGRSKIVMTNCKVQRLGGNAVKALQGSKVKLNSCTSKEIGGEICFADPDSSVEFA